MPVGLPQQQKPDADKLRKNYAAIIFEQRKRDRIEQVSKHLGVPPDRIFSSSITSPT